MTERLEIRKDTNKLEAPSYNPGRILKYALIGGIVGFALLGYVGLLVSSQIFEASLTKTMLGALNLAVAGTILGVGAGAALAIASESRQRYS